MKRAILLAVIFFLAACGKRGPLIPPEALVPAPVTDLSLRQKGNSFQVCWSHSGKEEWGGSLKDLAGFRVSRREVLPPDQDCEDCPTAYKTVKDVDPEYLRDVRHSVSGYCFLDSELAEGLTYRYKVVTLAKDGAAGKASNKATRKRIAPPQPPKVSSGSDSIGAILRWNSIKPGHNSAIKGFTVYRWEEGKEIPLIPITTVPADATRFVDENMEHGVMYHYIIRSLADVDGEEAESVPSNEVTGKFSLSD
jgi:predicted small lipoprotein YifL